MGDINSYSEQFGSLSVKITNGKQMPNKAIMLLSVIDLIRCGYISSNKIYLNDTIHDAFCYNWQKYINESPPTPWTPFWHLKKEAFWHFRPVESEEEISSIAKPGETASLKEMRRTIRYAYLDRELYYLIQSHKTRDILQKILIDKYIRN